MKKISRRRFIGKSVAGISALSVSSGLIGAPAIIKNLGKPNSLFGGVQIGTITYSFRSLPTDAGQVLKYCVDANVSAIELMGPTAESFAGAPNVSTAPMQPFGQGGQRPQPTPEQIAEREERAKAAAAWRASVSMEKFEQLKKMYKKAGVSIYAYKPSAFGVNNSDAEVHYGMRAARALGATHITLEFPNDAAQTRRLSTIAAQYKMLVAYHGHEQQTPTLWDAALEESPYNALNCDLGHYVAAGHDPVELIKAKHSRIASAHLKDRKTRANGGANLPWGEGDTPLVEILETMKVNKYKFPGTVEVEYGIPEGSDAVKEVAKCVEFSRKVLEGKV